MAREISLLLTGILLLGGSIPSTLPQNSVAQNSEPASVQSSLHHASSHWRTERSEFALIAQKAILILRSKKQFVIKEHTAAGPYLAPVSASSTSYRKEPAPPPLLPVVNQLDIKPHHRELANDVLRALPETCIPHLKRFYVRYDNPEHRGLAGSNSIILDGSVPDDEFRALLIHEFGHITDLGCLRGTMDAGNSAFWDGSNPVYADDPSVSFYQISWVDSSTKKHGVSQHDFVSGYASWNPFEDFAETYAYYILQKDAFIRRAQQNAVLAAKLEWMERHAFPGGIAIAEGKQWNGAVPWDVTKLTYEWQPAR